MLLNSTLSFSRITPCILITITLFPNDFKEKQNLRFGDRFYQKTMKNSKFFPNKSQEMHFSREIFQSDKPGYDQNIPVSVKVYWFL